MAMQSERKTDQNFGQNDATELGPSVAGEDESSTEKEGDDSHLHDDQKCRPLAS